MAQFSKNLFTTSVSQRTHGLLRFSKHTITGSCALSVKSNNSKIVSMPTNNGNLQQKRHKFSFQDDDNSFGSNFDTDFSPISESRFGGSGMGFGREMQTKRRWSKQNIRWSDEDLTPFRKDFYKEHPSVTAMSDDEVKRMRENSNMICFGTNVPKPFKTFQESAIPGMCD